MDGLKSPLFLGDELRTTAALLKTISLAVGNKEVFEENLQCIAISLDLAVIKIEECCQRLERMSDAQS